MPKPTPSPNQSPAARAQELIDAVELLIEGWGEGAAETEYQRGFIAGVMAVREIARTSPIKPSASK